MNKNILKTFEIYGYLLKIGVPPHLAKEHSIVYEKMISHKIEDLQIINADYLILKSLNLHKKHPSCCNKNMPLYKYSNIDFDIYTSVGIVFKCETCKKEEIEIVTYPEVMLRPFFKLINYENEMLNKIINYGKFDFGKGSSCQEFKCTCKGMNNDE